MGHHDAVAAVRRRGRLQEPVIESLLRAVFQLDRYQSGIDHSLIDLESGMVNWYLRIPLSSLILLSSDGAVFSRDPCIGLLQCSGKRKNMAGNGRKQPEKVGYGKKRDGI